MSVVIDTFIFGMGLGMEAGIVLVFFVNALENVKNAILDIIRGESNNQTKEDYIK